MSRLVYAWYHDYLDGYIHNQGITLIKEYLINTNVLKEDESNVEVEINIEKNFKYKCPRDFYGKNIDGVTAIIGENGSGKTTLVEMLMDCPLDTISDSKSKPFFWIEISDDENIIIYSYNVTVRKLENVKIFKWTENIINAVYMTNLLDFTKLSGKRKEDDLDKNFNQVRREYSPAHLLLRCKERAIKQKYGYWGKDSKYLYRIKEYAELVEQSELAAYMKKQEALMIEGYIKTSEKVKDTLGIFKKYKIEVNKFPENIDEKIYSKREKKAMNAAKNLYDNLCKKWLIGKEQDLWLNLYILCIVELYIVFYNKVNFINLINDENNYDKIYDYLLKHKLIRGTQFNWEQQMIDFLAIYKENKDSKRKGWTLGEHNYEDSQELLQWYYGELCKSSSFINRNLFFEASANSTGELAMLNLFSYITDAMTQSGNQKNFLLVIDEIDAGLHPRWQQRISKYMLDWLNSFEGYRFQLVITSHSPIVLSDILKEHVVRIKRDSDSKLLIDDMKEPTFGANIAMQFLDSFYMDKGNIGAFSKQKIHELIENIKDLKEDEYEKRQTLEYLIDSIGEELVRKKLHKDISMKTLEYKDLLEQWEGCSEEERGKILQYIKELKGNE